MSMFYISGNSLVDEDWIDEPIFEEQELAKPVSLPQRYCSDSVFFQESRVNSVYLFLETFIFYAGNDSSNDNIISSS